MDMLNSYWFNTPLSLPQKREEILNYLAMVSHEFSQNKLFPSFSDLKKKQSEISTYFFEMRKFRNSNRGRIKGLDLNKKTFTYDSPFENFEALNESEEMYAALFPLIREKYESGNRLFQNILSEIDYDIVGIMPEYKKEGYFLIQNPGDRIMAYEYRQSPFLDADGHYYKIVWRKIGDFEYRLNHTPGSIKRELIKTRVKLPNPATYFFYSRNNVLPIAETFITATLYYLKRNLGAA